MAMEAGFDRLEAKENLRYFRIIGSIRQPGDPFSVPSSVHLRTKAARPVARNRI
jgi:hypothetical protein